MQMKRLLDQLQHSAADFPYPTSGLPSFKNLLYALLVLFLVISLLPLVSAGAQTTNLALNRPVTCSSIENAGTPCASAVDGNATSTRWASAFADPQWIYVDLGATYNITRVVLIWEAAYGRSYQIQVSGAAGGPWSNIYTTTTGNGATDDLTGLSGSGRYVRMNGTVRATQWGYSLWEFQVYGTSGTGPTNTPTRTATRTNTPIGPTATRTRTPTVTNTPVPTGCGTTNIALGKVATSSSNENAGTTPNLAVDGNATTTRWASAFSDPQWIQIDLGTSYIICRVVLTWEAAYGSAYQIQTSTSATGPWANIFTTTTGNGATDDLVGLAGSGRYIRMNGTTRATGYGYSLWEFAVYVGSGGPTITPGGPTNTPTRTNTPGTGPTNTPTRTPTQSTGVCSQPNIPNFGPNVRIFEDNMSDATIQTTLNADFELMKSTQTAQFAETRRAHLFKPGSYNVFDNVGFYLSVAGLGLNPTDVTINGAVTVDAFNASDAGNATQNFWRATENLTVNTTGGSNRWAVAQAAPFRRLTILGGLLLYPASFGWASGGYISDSKVTGQVASASQQQWYSKDSNYGSWDGAVWNMV